MTSPVRFAWPSFAIVAASFALFADCASSRGNLAGSSAPVGAPRGAVATATVAPPAIVLDEPSEQPVLVARAMPEWLHALAVRSHDPEHRAPIAALLPLLVEGDRVLAPADSGMDLTRPVEVVWRSRSRALDDALDRLRAAVASLPAPPSPAATETARAEQGHIYSARADVIGFAASMRRECRSGALSERFRFPARDTTRLSGLLIASFASVGGLHRVARPPEGIDAVFEGSDTPFVLAVWHTNDAVYRESLSEPLSRCLDPTPTREVILARLRAELVRLRADDRAAHAPEGLAAGERVRIVTHGGRLTRWSFAVGVMTLVEVANAHQAGGPVLSPEMRPGFIAVGMREAAGAPRLVDDPTGVSVGSVTWALQGPPERPTIEVQSALARWASPAAVARTLRVPTGFTLAAAAQFGDTWPLPNVGDGDDVRALRIVRSLGSQVTVGSMAGAAHLALSSAALATIADWGLGFAPLLAVPGLSGIYALDSSRGPLPGEEGHSLVVAWIAGNRPEEEVRCALRGGHVPCADAQLRRDATVPYGRMFARLARVDDQWFVSIAFRAATVSSARLALRDAPADAPLAQMPLTIVSAEPPTQAGPDHLARLLHMLSDAPYAMTLVRAPDDRARLIFAPRSP